MRLGALPAGQLLCRTGERVRFVRGEAVESATQPSSAAAPTTATTPDLTTTYEPLIDELQAGNRIMLADGIVSLIVEKVGNDSAECRVLQAGLIRSRQGVNLPGVKLSVPALNEIDRENALWAARSDIDFVGLSFVRRAEDVQELKALLAAAAGRAGDGPQVIAKIEKPEALAALVEVVAAADGVMVARGDLGVEIDIAQVAVAQKRIIAECRRQRKPVIVATQMLDSMQHSRLPTRAEVTDVSNAILDGADACMLSGETAIGEYPRETVEMMNRIALAAEPLYGHRGEEAGQAAGQAGGSIHGERGNTNCPAADGLNAVTEAVVCQAGRLAEQIDARLIIVASASGATALSLAKNRFRVPTVGVSDSAATLRRMCLYWGVIPLASAPVSDSRTLVAFISAWGEQNGLLSAGDRIVLIAGTGTSVSTHNMIEVKEVE